MTSSGEMTEADVDVAYLGVGETLRGAGHRMRELGVAALPVCGQDGKFQGIITRSMMAESIAAGGDPKAVTVGEVASMRSPPPSAVRQAVPASGAPEGHNKRVAPVTDDYRRTREATGTGLMRYGTELRIGELADAVRAAADALSGLSAVHGCA